MEEQMHNTTQSRENNISDNISDTKVSWDMMSREALCAVRQWKVNHEKEYARFKAKIMRSLHGDYTEYYKIFKLAVQCIPPFAMEGIRAFFDDTQNANSSNPELNEVIVALVSSNGYKKFDKKRLNASCEWLLSDNEEDIENNLEGFNFEIVEDTEDMDDDESCLYQKITSTMDFWYGLPWDMISAIRNFTPNMKEEQRAILTRTLYYKVLFSFSEIIENVEALAKGNCYIYNVLYYLIYDHGFKTSYRTIVHSLTNSNNIGSFRLIVSRAISLLAKTSISKGYETKGEWKKNVKLLQETNMCIELQGTIDSTHGVAGRPRKATNIIELTDMLIGDIPSLLSLIKEYRREYSRPVDLAYLFIILHHSDRINQDYYAVFHHAMESLEKKKYDLRNPQEVYNNFPGDDEILSKRGTAYQKRIALRIKEWERRFHDQRLSA